MMKTSAQVRSLFIDYFSKHNHVHVPASSLIPHNDPTLLFTNAGMVQFKDVFTGIEERPYKRAVTSQKCLRAGGKHNDLENVGFTARHHTFFEMLGNFSFGDYFKEEAIYLAWQCITKEYGLPPEKLCVTVYAEDHEAAKLWKSIAGLADDRIIPIATSDNFWSMGDVGPCGPCSEIFYDHGESIPGGPPGSAEADKDRFIEIWNLVFMQFEQLASGDKAPLPNPSIDTGMGLERITAIMQSVHNNYETDIFCAIIKSCEEALSLKAHEENISSFRVIADHLRSTSFLLADGILPSNEGRGYVLRRIMRRAMRHAHLLGAKEPLLHRLVPALIEQMGGFYPELSRASSLMTQALRWEEERFKEMLERGLKLLHDEVKKLSEGATLPGSIAFKLYDTFGFPLDLTQDALKPFSCAVDVEGFNAQMAKQKAESKAHWAGSGESKADPLWLHIQEKQGSTEFLGYDRDQAEGIILELIKDGQPVLEAQNGEQIYLIANQTPFYAESGGQMGDIGTIDIHGHAHLTVMDTLKKAGKIHAHVCQVHSGCVKRGQTAKFIVNKENRDCLRRHHSATHLLHAALRAALGPHVTQKGSLVAPGRLRFDFSHPHPLTKEQIRQIEKTINTQIRMNAPVATLILPAEEALRMGAMALFGEKYSDEVRVVTMGNANDATGSDEAFSLELCGGTHVKQTGDIGSFRIALESNVASGVRRIEAVAGEAADSWVDDMQDSLQLSASALKAPVKDLLAKLQLLLDEKRKLEQENKRLKQQMHQGSKNAQEPFEAAEIHGCKIGFYTFKDMTAQELRSITDQLRGQKLFHVIVVFNQTENKVAVVVSVQKDSPHLIDAARLVQKASHALGGTGGGRPDFAQGGGDRLEKIPEALKLIQEEIEQQV